MARKISSNTARKAAVARAKTPPSRRKASSALLVATTTIDYTTNDNGYLGCMRNHFGGYRLHSSTAGAVDNLLQLNGKSAQIVGHGNIALVITGTGQHASESNKYMALGNSARWKPQIRRLKGHIKSLRIIACDTGAEAGGADFLFTMAKECNAAVRAATGLVWCGSNRWWLDPGATWQLATPKKKPKPIPMDREGQLFGEITMLVLYDGNRKLEVNVKDVEAVTYQPIQILQSTRSTPITVEGESAEAFMSFVSFAAPFEPGGVPAAMVTGTLTVKLKSLRRKWSFSVYNDRLLQDSDKPSVFYRTAGGFREALQTLS